MRRTVITVVFGIAMVSAVIGAESLTTQREEAHKDGDRYAEIEIIRRLLDEEPKNEELRAALIRLWLEVGDFGMTEQTLGAWPEVPPGLRAIATAEIQAGLQNDSEGAKETLREYLKSAPDDVEATQRLVAFYGSEPEQARDFLMASPLTEKNQELLLRRAAAQRTLGNYAVALADYERARGLDAGSELIRNARPSYERLSLALPSLEMAEGVLKNEPENFPALMQRGYYSLGADLPRQQVLADAERGLAGNADAVAPLLLLAKTAPLSPVQISSRYGVEASVALPEPVVWEQLVRLDSEIAVSPGNAALRMKRASLVSDALLQYRLALRDAQVVLQSDPGNVDAVVGVVYAASRLNDLTTAREWVGRLADQRESNKALAQACFYLSEAELSNGSLEVALQLINKALQGDSKPVYLKQRAAIYTRLNRASEADADLAKAAALEKRR